MAEMGFTPELQASDNVFPFRFVALSGAFTGTATHASAAAGGQSTTVGVADGSVYQASPLLASNAQYHAISGTPITLQPSNTVQVEVGAGGVSAGAFLMSDANGKAITLANLGASTLAVSSYIALEAGSAGEIIRAFRFGTRYLTGS